METLKQKYQQLQSLVMTLLKQQTLSDDEKMQYSNWYQTFKTKLESKEEATVGEILRYGENENGEAQIYEVITKHTPQEDWTPDVATSLFKKIGFTDDGTAIWTQPLGADDAYQIGDIVYWNDTTWVSDVSNNVWQPGIYGWSIQTDVE
ncbi:hypothetical protein [Chakrabartyella piscis]|uniref:hypothetical protein n=1 Tax=Chakrabartyella piscis TaxID=2918914 RepID=UPI002958930E|nr:hypothetical protein [Chakrabartyella piscis]